MTPLAPLADQPIDSRSHVISIRGSSDVTVAPEVERNGRLLLVSEVPQVRQQLAAVGLRDLLDLDELRRLAGA